jgi:peroxiredoxin-like protein
VATTTHYYPAEVTWAGARDGKGHAGFQRSGEGLALAVPPEFGGAGGSSNPEELLTGAVAACYSITFGIIAENRKLPVISITTAATGEVEQVGASMTFKRIVLAPNIQVSEDTTDAQVAAVHEMALKADQYCIVSNAVRGKVEIVIRPTVSQFL